MYYFDILHNCYISFGLLSCRLTLRSTDFILATTFSEDKRDHHSKMKNESVKKSLEKSRNVIEEKRKMVKRKICIKETNTFTIIAMNFVQEQLIINNFIYLSSISPNSEEPNSRLKTVHHNFMSLQ